MIPNQKQLGILFVVLSIILIIVLVYIKVIFDDQAVFLCEAVSLDPDVNMAQCPAHNPTHSWLLTIGFIVSGILLFVGTYFLMPKYEKKTYKQIKKSDLNEDELNVYNFLLSKQGTAYQSDIVKSTEFSKVKVTRILDGLEQKDVVERKRRGMTNIVLLK